MTNNCAPQNVYGSFDQTLFMGCSVLSFTANAGLNEQSSELTIELAQDPCNAAKTYIPTNANSFNPIVQAISDPGFTAPAIGAPAYFRVADFEYAGIMQSWTERKGEDGLPLYTVKLTDPRSLLDNVQLIVDDYHGHINNLSNIVNVYGFLDSLLQNCPLVGIGDVNFGSVAGGWGVSSTNKAGIPWNLVKNAVQVLLGNNAAAVSPNFSKGWVYGPPGGNGGFGEIYTGGPPYSANSLPAKYILDISEIPFAPAHYRISGPIISVSELISQVCRDSGCDYFVELLPTANALVIKVRVILRSNQPAMGEITQFINNSSAVTNSSTIGKEYRPNPNNIFVMGDKVRSLYRHTGVNTTGSLRTIQPYWGRDLDGVLCPSYENTCETNQIIGAGPAIGPGSNWLGPPDWNVRLDIREIAGQLTNKIDDSVAPKQAYTKAENGRVWIWEGEMRASLGDFKTFSNYILQNNLDPDCTNDTATFLKLYFQDLNAQFAGGGAWNPAMVQRLLQAIDIQVFSRNPQGPTDDEVKDLQTVYKWLQKYTRTHYGRQWLVEIPFACWAGDSGNPNFIEWSDEPSTEGGWSDAPEILFLENSPSHGIAIDRFKSADGRIEPILRWTQSAPYSDSGPAANNCERNPCMTGLKYTQVPMANFVTNTFDDQPAQGADLYLWQKAEISPQWVTGSPYVGSNQDRVFAHLICDPVYTGMPEAEGKRDPKFFTVKSGLRDNSTLVAAPAGGTLSSTPLNGNFADRMISPQAAAVPVLSHTQTYGPWYKESLSYGTMAAEQDSTLSPWEYGGTSFMNLAGLSKVDSATTFMNFAERGEVTVAGYPTKSLGAGITSTIVPYSARALNVANFYGLPYNYVPLASSAAGASLANINVVVSPQGVTTTYTVSTFTPVFGRFSKTNAQRIKEIGRLRLAGERARRKQDAQATFRRLEQGGTLSLEASTLLGALTAGPAYSQNSSAVMLVGHLVEGEPKRKQVVLADKNTLGYYGDYDSTAMMTMDGLLRPVSKSGEGNLPAMKAYTGVFCPSTGIAISEATGAYSGFDSGNLTVENRYSPILPPPPIKKAEGLVVASNYLDPLADPKSNSTFTMDIRATGSLGTGVSGMPLYGSGTTASGHDIESVARGTTTGIMNLPSGSISGQSLLIAGESGRYSGDYRFLALKGPMVLQSWGYDTYGKPIPNSRGWSGDPTFETGIPRPPPADTGNTHQKGQSGLTDRFAPNWLSDASNWPVAPVDLRFDRARGVWTTPMPFRLMKAQAIEDIDSEATGMAEILTADDMFNADGLRFKDIPVITGYDPTGTGAGGEKTGVPLMETGIPPLINLENFGTSSISKDDKFVVYYDTHSCEYWTVGGAGGGAGCGGATAVVTVVTNFRCVGDIIEACTATLEFEDGCLKFLGGNPTGCF